MINIRIQVFSKKGLTGLHLERDPMHGKPRSECMLAVLITEAVHAALVARQQKTGSTASIVETTAKSAINKRLRKEFGLDENSQSEQG